MLSRRVSSPLFASARWFASVSQNKPVLSSSKLSNGVQIGTYENHAPTSNITLVVKAGSRFETPENLGQTHFLKHFAFKGVKGRSHVRLVKEMDNHGANLISYSNRENLVFSADFLRNDLPLVAELLSGILTSPEFVLHDVEAVKHIVEEELNTLSENVEARLFEVLHKNAFRVGLGNSLYCSHHNVSSVNTQSLLDYTSKHFVGGNVSIAGVGVNHEQLHELASHYFGSLQNQTVAATPSKYYGGDVSLGRLDDQSRAIVAYETSNMNQKDFATYFVLKHILSSKNTAAPFFINYPETGLFGYSISLPHTSSIVSSLKAANDSFKSISSTVSNDDLNRGKNSAKFSALAAFETQSQLAEFMGKSLFAGELIPSSEVSSRLDAVTAADIQKLSAKLLQSKPTTVVAADDF